MIDLADRPHKILVIDDDQAWRNQIGIYAGQLKYNVETASSYEDAKSKLKEAEEEGTPFSVATIDMQFKVGEERTSTPCGEMILEHIKSEHPYVACIMISARTEADEVLDLRDDYDLDYYIPKDRLGKKTLRKAVARAMRRVRPLGNIERRLEMAKKTLGILKGNCLLCAYNLAEVEQKKAQRGIDVSVSIENEIRTYKTMLEHFREGVRQTEEEIREIEEEICHLKGS